LATAPETVVTYLAGQLNLRPNVLADYGQRSQTRTEHLQEVMAYLYLEQGSFFYEYPCIFVQRVASHGQTQP
jgi:hypothetical protein